MKIFSVSPNSIISPIHVGGEVRAARRLLHIMSDDHHGVLVLQFRDQFLDAARRDRVQRGARLVQQQHFGADGDAARDAQALLLAAGEAIARLVQLVLGLVPQRRLGQRPFHAVVHLGARQLLEQAHAEGDVVVDGHRERRRLLEHHAHLGAQQRDVLARGQQVLAIHVDLALGALLRIERVHLVQRAQQGRFAATGRADEGRHLAVGDRHVDVLQRMELAVVEVQVAHVDLGADAVGNIDDGGGHACVSLGICWSRTGGGRRRMVAPGASRLTS